MEIIFLIGIIIYFVFWGLKEIIYLLFGAVHWCERCNKWDKMKYKSGNFLCNHCGYRNHKNGGCPICGWFSTDGNGYIGRVGPFSEIVGFSVSAMLYKETWKCPQHGEYTIKVPASRTYDFNDYSNEQYKDPSGYDDLNYEDDYSHNRKYHEDDTTYDFDKR